LILHLGRSNGWRNIGQLKLKPKGKAFRPLREKKKGVTQMKNRVLCLTASILLLIIGLTTSFHSTKAAPPSYLNVIPLSTYNIDSTGFTVEFWVKVRSLPGFDPRIIRVVNQATFEGCGNPDFSEWELTICHLSCTPGTVYFNTVQQGTCHEMSSNTTIIDSNFHHIAGTYDDTTMKVYIDGVLKATMSAANVKSIVGGGFLVVGNATTLSNPFDGQIDELRIWKVARTQAEILANMSTEISVQPNLVAYWRFNGNSADLVARNNLCSGGDVSYVSGMLGQAVDISEPRPGPGFPILPYPTPCFPSADLNCDGNVSPADVVIELNMTFLGASAPC
jgi:hypothetical protein